MGMPTVLTAGLTEALILWLNGAGPLVPVSIGTSQEGSLVEAALGRDPWCWEGKVHIVRMEKLKHREQQGLPRTPITGRKVGLGPAGGECWAPALWEQGSQIFPGIQGVIRTPQGEDRGGSVPHPPMCPAKVGSTLGSNAGGLPLSPVSGPDRK